MWVSPDVDNLHASMNQQFDWYPTNMTEIVWNYVNIDASWNMINNGNCVDLFRRELFGDFLAFDTLDPVCSGGWYNSGGVYYRKGIILGLHLTNQRRRYEVTLSLIGWAQT